MTIFLGQEYPGPIEVRKGSSPVNIANNQHVGLGVSSHAQIDQVHVGEIDLGRAACPLQDHHIDGGRHPVESIGHGAPQPRGPLPPRHPAQLPIDLSINHDLTRGIGFRLQKNGIVIGAGLDPGRQCLEVLGGTDLTTDDYSGIVGHVLSLERSHPHAPTAKGSTKCRRHEALSRPRRRASHHERLHQ